MLNAQIAQGAAGAIKGFAALVVSLAANSARISGATKGIGLLVADASFGRYDNGALAGSPALPPIDLTQPVIAQVSEATAEMLAQAITQQTELEAAASEAVSAALLIADPPTALVTALMALTETVRAAVNDPADQIRLLSALAVYSSSPPVSSAPIGAAIATLWNIELAVARRSALISLASASADYLPSSYDDAVAVRTSICALLDAEITLAADGDDDATYSAFRDMRTAVAADLETRGAQLPRLATFTFKAAIPSLVLAYRIYQDAARDRELVARADPPMSLFMPLSFKALSD